MLGMGRVASKCGFDFAIYNDIDLDAGFGTTLEDLVESPFLVIGRRSTQKEFGRKPPIGNVDGLFGLFESYRDSLSWLSVRVGKVDHWKEVNLPRSSLCRRHTT